MREMNQTFIRPYVTEDYIYAATLLGEPANYFFRIDRKTYEANLLWRLSDYGANISLAYRAVLEYKGKCFIFSNRNYDVFSYDLLTGEKVNFSPEGGKYYFDKIQSIIQMQDKVWIFQDILNPQVMVFSLATFTYEKKNIDLSGIGCKDKIMVWGYETTFLIGRELWKVAYGTNQMLGINIDNLKTRVCRLPIKEGLLGFAFVNNKGYFLTSKMNIMVTSDTFEIVKIIKAPPSCGTEMDYGNFVVYNDKIIYIPCYSDKLIYTELNCEEQRFYEIHLPQDFSRVIEEYELMCENAIVDGHLLLFPMAGNGLIDVDLQTLKAKNHIIKWPALEEQLICDLKSHDILSEKNYSLGQYLNAIIKWNPERNIDV